MTNKTVKELREVAKGLGVKNYSKMNKAELEIAVKANTSVHLTAEDLAYVENYKEPQTQKESAQTMTTTNTNTNSFIVTDFDIQRYAKFIPSVKMISNPITANQLNLVKSLENNFKVAINTKDCKGFYDLSVKLANVYQAILSGRVQRRPIAEVEARVKAYAPASDNKATKAQLDAITKLEKETGIKVTTVISSKQVANTVIKTLIAKRQTLKEVAVDKAPKTTIQSKLEDKTFRTKFVAFLKRALA